MSFDYICDPYQLYRDAYLSDDIIFDHNGDLLSFDEANRRHTDYYRLALDTISRVRTGCADTSDDPTRYIFSFDSNLCVCTWSKNTDSLAECLDVSTVPNIYLDWLRSNLAHYMDRTELPLCANFSTVSGRSGRRGGLIEMIALLNTNMRQCVTDRLMDFTADELEDLLFLCVNGGDLEYFLQPGINLSVIRRAHSDHVRNMGYDYNLLFVDRDEIRLEVKPCIYPVCMQSVEDYQHSLTLMRPNTVFGYVPADYEKERYNFSLYLVNLLKNYEPYPTHAARCFQCTLGLHCTFVMAIKYELVSRTTRSIGFYGAITLQYNQDISHEMFHRPLVFMSHRTRPPESRRTLSSDKY